MKRVCCLFAQSAGWSQWEGETAGLEAGRTTSVVARSQRPLSVRVDAQRERISSGLWTAVADTARSQSFQLIMNFSAGARKKGCFSPFIRDVHARSGSADAHFGQSTVRHLALGCIVDDRTCGPGPGPHTIFFPPVLTVYCAHTVVLEDPVHPVQA